MAQKDWTPEELSNLALWWSMRKPDDSDYLYTVSEIGFLLHRTKNSVGGKAHRLDLPGRPSPIGKTKRERGVRAPGSLPLPPAKIAEPDIPAPPPPPEPVRSTRTCCWPIGTPGTKDFRFCESTIPFGKVYCATHAKRAYQKKEKAA